MPRRERSDVDDQPHGVVPGMVRVQVIPGQLRELAVRQEDRLHVAGGVSSVARSNSTTPSKSPEWRMKSLNTFRPASATGPLSPVVKGTPKTPRAQVTGATQTISRAACTRHPG